MILKSGVWILVSLEKAEHSSVSTWIEDSDDFSNLNKFISSSNNRLSKGDL